MSNGAAGCGLEYQNTNGTCGFLQNTPTGFECLKYHTKLKTNRTTKHPFRCSACCESATREAESKLASQRKVKTALIRQATR